MLDVLKTVKYVVDNSRHVRIVKNQIVNLTEILTPESLEITDTDFVKYKWDKNTFIQLAFLFDTINYCYWAKKDEPKWTVERGGEVLDGAIALFRCLEEETRSNPTFTSGYYLANISMNDLCRVLDGNVDIPLLRERVNGLNEAGTVLTDKYGGDYLNVLAAAERDAVKLAELLVKDFPGFTDVSEYHGEKVGFYKRAQYNSKMVNDILVSFGESDLKNLDKLTAIADYKIPQKLRYFGILEYDKELANKVDSLVLLEHDSDEEIEIRANTVWAMELLTEQAKVHFPSITTVHLDSVLWALSQKKKADEKPYHRTLTIDY